VAAKYRRIDPRIWNDEKFQKLSIEERLLTFWILTSSRINRCGFVLWSPGLASEETGIPRNRIDTVCDTVCDTVFWIRDPASKTIFLPTFFKYNPPDNLKAFQGALSDLHDVPATSLKSLLSKTKVYLKPSFHHVIDTVCHTLSDTVCDTVSTRNSNSNSRKGVAAQLQGIDVSPTVDSSKKSASETKVLGGDGGKGIANVVEHYQSHHPRAQPGDKERALIRARLKDGFSVEDLQAAIDGCHNSPFHGGENTDGRKYQSLALIMRDASHVTQFMEQPVDEPVMSEKERRGRRAAEQFLAMGKDGEND